MAMQRQPIPLGGGVNTYADPTALPDGQWQRLRNLATRQTGVLGQRPSLSFVREVMPNRGAWDARILNGYIHAPVAAYWRWAHNLRPLKFMFDPNFGEITMVALVTAATTIQEEVAPGIVSIRVVPDGTLLLLALPGVMLGDGTDPILRCAVLADSPRAPSMFAFNGVTYAFAGANIGRRITPEPSPTTTTPNAFSYDTVDFGPGNENFHPDGACVVRDRVVYFKGPNLYFSDKNDPLTISPSGFPAVGTRDIYLGGEELEDITAVAEISTSADGSPVQSVAMAWTSTRAYMLLGDTLESTEPGPDIVGSMQINRLNLEAGCVSQATVTRTPYGTLWAGRDDVWFMPFGSLPIRVGTSIRPMLENQPNGLQWRMHAEYHDGFYRLSMFKPGQGPAVYDPCGMQMWLDLRRGAPRDANEAQWFGPQEFVQTDAPTYNGGVGGPAGVWCMARDTRATGDGKLYALQSFIIYGDPTSVRGMSLCGFDTYDGRDTTAPQAAVSAAWQPEAAYYEGDIFVPQPKADAVPYSTPIWICTTSGVSAATPQPDWTAATATGTITDGTVVWHLRYWDGSYPTPAYVASLMQGANEIEWSMLSKEYTLGDPMAEKLLDGAELGYFAADATRLTYNSHPDQDSASRILTPDFSVASANNLLETWNGARVWQRKLLTQSPTKRFHGLSAMWECAQDAGIVITAGVNDTFYFYQAEFRQATIAAGYYADLAALDTAVRAAMAAAYPGSTYVSTVSVDGNYSRPLYGIREATGALISIYSAADAAQPGRVGLLARIFGFTFPPAATASGAAYAFGRESPRIKFAPDMQLSGINLRFRMFGRRAT